MQYVVLLVLFFQDSALDRTMSIDENLQFAAAMYKSFSTRKPIHALMNCLTVFGLQNQRKKKLLALSGGQRRAVDIARGVLHKPKSIISR